MGKDVPGLLGEKHNGNAVSGQLNILWECTSKPQTVVTKWGWNADASLDCTGGVSIKGPSASIKAKGGGGYHKESEETYDIGTPIIKWFQVDIGHDHLCYMICPECMIETTEPHVMKGIFRHIEGNAFIAANTNT